MKKATLILLSFTIAGLTLFISCKGDKNTASKDSLTSTELSKPDTLEAADNMRQPDTTRFDKIGKYKFFFDEIVDPGTAKDMVDLYQAKRKRIIDSQYGIDDTKSIWYSIDKMEEFVKNVRANGGSGVRIYLGVYPSVSKYPGKTTIIAIGTKTVDGEERDLLMKKVTNQPTISADGLDPYNHGNLCPPGKNCGY